ncbi:MAG: Holliday junction resolvase RuvX [Bacillota bacterium]|nr:Holliday junction resolvase RuvX [Bacillota bacterium]
MRILALDVGTKNIGVAMSDPLGLTAQALPTIRRKGNLDSEVASLLNIIDEKGVETIVVGYPKNMNGTEGPSCDMAKEYAGAISEKTNVPIVFWDERLTSKMAESAMLMGDVSREKRRKAVDSLAAILILQNYLDYLGNKK